MSVGIATKESTKIEELYVTQFIKQKTNKINNKEHKNQMYDWSTTIIHLQIKINMNNV